MSLDQLDPDLQFIAPNFLSVQFCHSSCLTLCNPWTAARQASQSITNSQSLLKLMFIESVMSSNNLILCRPLLLLPSILPSIRVFSNDSILHIWWPKYQSFSFSISPLHMLEKGVWSLREMGTLEWVYFIQQYILMTFPERFQRSPPSPGHQDMHERAAAPSRVLWSPSFVSQHGKGWCYVRTNPNELPSGNSGIAKW